MVEGEGGGVVEEGSEEEVGGGVTVEVIVEGRKV